MRLQRCSLDRRSASASNGGSREFHPSGEELEDRTLPSGSPSPQAAADDQSALETIPLVRSPSGIWSGTLEINGTIGPGGQDFFLLNPETGDLPSLGGGW